MNPATQPTRRHPRDAQLIFHSISRTCTSHSRLIVALGLLIAGGQLSAQDRPPGDDDINVQYYRKNLELAQHHLQTALKANQRIPSMHSKLTMIRLKNQVLYAKELVAQATAKTDQDLHQTHLQNVENDLHRAEQQLRWATEANRKSHGSVGEDELKRLQLTVDLARLALQRAKQPEIFDDPLHHLQWQIDRLRSELLSLQVEFERTRASH